MERNGFTLVELLAVVVLLALIIVIVATSGFGAFDTAKNKINQIEEENLLEAGKTFLVDVDNGLCKDSSYCDLDYKSDYQPVSVDYIIKNYMKDNNHCNGEMNILLKISVDENGNVDYLAKKQSDEVICTN